MHKLIVVLVGVILSTGVSARDWSSYSKVSHLKIYDGNVISFNLLENTIKTDTCHDNLQYFILDMKNLLRPDFVASMILTAQATGERIRVLPSTSGTCISGGALIGSITFQN
jgi:hypothetical protein